VKFINFILLISSFLIAGTADDPEHVGSVSFRDAVWNETGNILYSKQKISDLTKDGKAVVLYLFESCFS
jgi:hypothetical protein